MLWSLIYRKLKGNRGNTMITLYEAERMFHLISAKNNNHCLSGNNFTFDITSQKIINGTNNHQYIGRMEQINIFPRLLNKYQNNLQFETHLQAYILQNIENIFQEENIKWIGNEVACGVGMQRIDIMFSSSINQINRKIVPIELKSTYAYPGIIFQLQRYVDWIRQYYLPNIPSIIEPIVISRFIEDKTTKFYVDIISQFNYFNNTNNLRIRYIEFIIQNSNINFTEVNY